jgi:hypothetical protein
MTKLLNILEKYKSRSGEDSGEQDFVYKHTDNIEVFDGPGVAEIRAAVDSSPGHVSQTELRHGYRPDEDASVYEELMQFDIEEIREALQTSDLDEETIRVIEESLFEEADLQIHTMVGEAVGEYYQEASDEERTLIDEMLATDEGYEELLDMLFAEEDEVEEQL